MSLTVHSATPTEQRSVGTAIKRGFMLRCPHCGEGALYRAYLKVNDRCPVCREELWHQRADDAPPYAVITIVGHIIVPAVLAVEMAWHPALWIHLVVWLPLTVLLSLAMLPSVKGALIGYQWAVRMHGFDPTSEEYEPAPPEQSSRTGTP